MTNKQLKTVIPKEIIEKKILFIRGYTIMLDSDLAILYGVPTKRLNEQVRRNIKRFPKDFMFQLNHEEYKNLKSQIVTSSLRSQIATSKRGGRRYLPFAFTEQGVAMLSSVLNSERAIQVNIGIMRVFVNIRRMVSSNKEILARFNQMEMNIGKKLDNTTKTIFKVIHKPLLPADSKLISPEKPFTNKKYFGDMIKSCRKYIYWVDKYFSKFGLELLSDSLEFQKVKNIKILMSIDKINEKLKDSFKDFKRELKNKGITCELRVILDKILDSSIHDRWIISDNLCLNLPSTDTLARGQFSEIKKTSTRPPFSEWWGKSKDIIADWNEILNHFPKKHISN